MDRIPKYLFRFLFAAVLAAGMVSCESRAELDARMDDIVGTYRLISLTSVSSVDRIAEIPQEEWEIATTARIFPVREGWIFEYTLPLFASDQSGLICHRIRQRVLWDPQFAQYCFFQLEESDFAGIGIDPALITMYIENGEIFFTHNLGRYACRWQKVK